MHLPGTTNSYEPPSLNYLESSLFEYKVESHKKKQESKNWPKKQKIDFITSSILILQVWNFVSTFLELFFTSKKKLTLLTVNRPSDYSISNLTKKLIKLVLFALRIDYYKYFAWMIYILHYCLWVIISNQQKNFFLQGLKIWWFTNGYNQISLFCDVFELQHFTALFELQHFKK